MSIHLPPDPRVALYRARTVHPMAGASGDTLVVRGAEVLGIGDFAALRPRWPAADVHLLPDSTIVPGFIDAHHHLATGAVLASGVDCTPRFAADIDSVCRRIAEYAAALPDGAWVFARGFDPLQLAEHRAPTRLELDAAAPRHPVLLVAYGGHEAIANSMALAASGVDSHTPDPPAGRIERGWRGRPTGRLLGEAYSRVEAICLQAHLRTAGTRALDHLLARERQLYAAGITHVCDPAVSSPLRDLYRAGRRAGLSMGLTLMPCSELSKLSAPWDRLGGPTAGAWDADAEATVGPVKLFLDGGEQCAMCFGIRDMVRLVGHVWRRGGGGQMATLGETRPRICAHGVATGQCYVGSRELGRLLDALTERGHGIAMHAIGNRAVGRALHGIDSVRGRHRDRPAPRIEHALFMDAEQIARAADLGAILVPQPGFLTLPSVGLVPDGLSVRVLPLRSARARGVVLAGGSDAPVADFDVLTSMARAVDREGADGRPRLPDEALDRREALTMYTTGAARACGLEDRIGALSPGRRADFVALSGDPLDGRVPLTDLRVEATWVGGVRRWAADEGVPICRTANG